MAKDERRGQPQIPSFPPLFTPEDLAAFKKIRPDLSAGAKNLVDLIVKIFGAENPPVDLAGLIQNLSSSGQEAVNMLYALYALMNGPYQPK